MNSWTQRVLISREKPTCRPVTSGVPLGLVLFNNLTNNLDGRIECTLNKYTDDVRMEGVAGSTEGQEAKQRDLKRLERWADKSLMKFNKEDVQSPAPGEAQPQSPVHAESHPAGKQPCREGLRSPGGLQVEHESAMCPCC